MGTLSGYQDIDFVRPLMEVKEELFRRFPGIVFEPSPIAPSVYRAEIPDGESRTMYLYVHPATTMVYRMDVDCKNGAQERLQLEGLPHRVDEDGCDVWEEQAPMGMKMHRLFPQGNLRHVYLSFAINPQEMYFGEVE